MVAVHCLLVALHVAATCVAVIALGCIVVSAYVWRTELSNVIVPRNETGVDVDMNDFMGAEVPAYAATLAFSSVLFIVSLIGIYGAFRRMRSAIFAFVSLGLISTVFQLIALAVLLAQTLSSDLWSEQLTPLASVSLFGATALELVLIFLVLVLFCVDPHGKSIYEEDLSWCSPGYVTSYISGAAIVNSILSAFLFAFSIGQYLRVVQDDLSGSTYARIYGLQPSMYVLMVATALNMIVGFLGVCGARCHTFFMLTAYIVVDFICIGLQTASSLVILIESNKARLNAAEQAVELNESELGLVMLVGAITLILSVVQFGTSFMVSLVMVTDKDSVFVADYF